MGGRRLPAAAHTARPWRIHELAGDFQLEDVWALPTPGGPDDFPRLLALFTTIDFEKAPLVVRLLWALRERIGALLGWDRRNVGLGVRVATLRDRLPGDLREAPPGPGFGPFTPVFLLPNEFAAELANRTVHGILHLGWVADGSGRYRGQLAVLVKPNGRLGVVYLAAIKPFRHLFVYPALLRGLERDWRASGA